MAMSAPSGATEGSIVGVGGTTPAETPGGGSLLGNMSDEEIGSAEMLGNDLLAYFRKGKEDAMEQALLDQEAQEEEGYNAME